MDDQFVNPEGLEEKTTGQIKEEYNFDKIKDAFDHAAVPVQSEFFYGGDNESFVRACNFLSSNEDNNEFVSFLCSDRSQNIMADNNLSIHIESGNLFSKISIQMKIFIAFCLHNKTKQIKSYTEKNSLPPQF